MNEFVGPTTRASVTETISLSCASQKSSAYFDGSRVSGSMLPPGDGAYVTGTVSGFSTVGAGRALPCESTVHCALLSSVSDWKFDVAGASG